MRWMKGTAALIGIAAILAGLPALLLVAGVLPASVPAPESWWSAVTSPDDGSTALVVITVVGWVCWAILAVSIVLEVAARLRGAAHAPDLPGLALPQSMARGLVGGAMLLIASSPMGTPASTAAPADVAAAPQQVAAAPSTPTEAPPAATTPSRDGATHEEDVADGEQTAVREITVAPGDSLWALSETHLGEGRRFTEILELNRDVLGANTSMLMPGTTLKVPDEGQVTVAAGDTLSEIAQDELGDAQRYEEIVEANEQIHDPDHIETGWVLDLPGHAADTEDSTVEKNEEAPESPSGSTRPESSEPRHQQAPPQSGAGESKTGPAEDARAQEPQATERAESPSAEASKSPQHGEERTSGTESEPVVHEDGIDVSWMIIGLSGAGALLSGGLYAMRRLNRRTALRSRNPGRTVIAPSEDLASVDRTISQVGSSTTVTVEWMDQALRRLAARMAGATMPSVAAVELTGEAMTLHLAEEMEGPAPWTCSEDRKRWTLTTDIALEHVGPEVTDQVAPYPLLVTIGSDGDGKPWWLLNLEDTTLVITGDSTAGVALARYLAAEVAVNAWSHGSRVHLLGVGEELEGLNPERMSIHDQDEDPAAEILLDTIESSERAAEMVGDVVSLRAAGAGEDTWPARALMVDGGRGGQTLGHLESTVRAVRRSGTGVIRLGGDVGEGTVLNVDASGRVRLPGAGLDVQGVGLSAEEATACARLAMEYRRIDEVPIPAVEEPSRDWEPWSDCAGALREEHTLARESAAEEPPATTTTVLPEEDDIYLQVGATTKEDLQRLSPRVEEDVTEQVQADDPTLDADLAAWHSDHCEVPRVRLLGPVSVTPVNGRAATERKAYRTEVVSYLALHPNGVTKDQVQTDFDVSENRARTIINQARDWLGTHPRTQEKHVPDARRGPAAQKRGVPVYELVDVLVDADLFRRLRVRGQARGAAGLEDLQSALSLVEGRPFDQLRPGGWSWLTEGERLDEVLTHGIVDTAHLLTTAALQAGDLRAARAATETARMAAPYEQIPELDLARIAEAEGDQDEAEEIVRAVCNTPDDEGPPHDLPERTRTVMDAKDWGKPQRRAS